MRLKSLSGMIRSIIHDGKEAERLECPSTVQIELEAASLAAEWNSLFGRELALAAIELADGADRTDSQPCRTAFPVAMVGTRSVILSQACETSHAAPPIA